MTNEPIQTDKFLTVDDTRVMKAVAITLMLMHHLWCFSTRTAGEPLEYLFTIFGIPSTIYFGFFGKICVPMFFFFGGYGTYLSQFGKKYDMVGKLKKLYFAYWKVFLIFIPIGFIFFSTQDAYCQDAFIYTRFANFSLKELVSNFIGFTSTYNREWWFLISYAFALLTFPLIRAIIDKFSTRINIFLAIVVTILMTNIFPGVIKNQTLGVLGTNMLYIKVFCQTAPYAACFWMGAIVARNGILDRLSDSMKKNGILSPVADIGIWMAVIFLRQSEIGDKFDIFFIPALTVATIDIVRRIRLLRSGLVQLGKQSTNMWLIHTFFCYYFGVMSKVVTTPRYAILSLILLIALSFVAGTLVDLFWKGLGKFCDRGNSILHPLLARLVRKNPDQSN